MMPEAQVERVRKLYCVPVYLQELGYHSRYEADFVELGARATRIHPKGFTDIQPWSSWRGLAGYLACVESARHSVRALPIGHLLTLAHALPAQYHTVALVLFAQALADNLAGWLSKYLPLSGVSGGDQSFLKKPFRKEFTKSLRGSATAFLSDHNDYLEELDRYRQVWIHQHIGGGVLLTTEAPRDPSAEKMVGVPIDPAFDFQAPHGQARAEKSAKTNGGRYLYPAPEFADRIADGAVSLFVDTLRLSLANVR